MVSRLEEGNGSSSINSYMKTLKDWWQFNDQYDSRCIGRSVRVTNIGDDLRHAIRAAEFRWMP